MVHIPSFLVGSTVAGITFLALHQQLSHRERLTYRWKLRGTCGIVPLPLLSQHLSDSIWTHASGIFWPSFGRMGGTANR
jgi:hypothetical protein